MSIHLGSNSLAEYIQLLKKLDSYTNVPEHLRLSLLKYARIVYRSDQQNQFSEPMPWIGMYIVLASLFCIFAMVSDLLHGFRIRKLWFPCKYFTLNAAFLSVIAVAMKLPVDLNNSMPGNVDQVTKIGSMAFMCTMMANLLPSLAAMDSKELVTNIIALGVLVITLVVNVCIQIVTGVVSYPEDEHFIETVLHLNHSEDEFIFRNKSIAIIYVCMLLMLLIIHTCSAFMILSSKKVLQSKYQNGHETIIKNQQLGIGILSVEKLKQHVSYYWIMAGTGSPQFMTACSATTSASGVICATSCLIHANTFRLTIDYIKDYDSDYKWSIVVIFFTQFAGVVLGTIAPLSRCFTGLSFKLSINWIWTHINVFKVETYWTRILSDLKWSGIPFSCSSRRSKIIFQNTKILILNLCIQFQKTVVVACKITGLVPIIIVICVLCCSHCWKWLRDMLIESNIVLVYKSQQQHTDKDFSHCVLQLQNDIELAERALKRISNSVNKFIQKSEKNQPKNLMMLLNRSKVAVFDRHHVTRLLFEKPDNCWSLNVITLTSIALSLPNIRTNLVDSLLKSVSEGLLYVTLVEESLCTNEDCINVQTAAKILWLEVEVYHNWLGYQLHKIAPQVTTSLQILEWFRDTAKHLVMEIESMDNEGANDESIYRCISANSMGRVTETILLSFHEKVVFFSEERFFGQLLSMISEILAACFTHLPEVIAMRCYARVIEESEISVHAAAQLLGETMEIISSLQDRENSGLNPNESLQDREFSGLNPNEIAFIDKWHAYLNHPFP